MKITLIISLAILTLSANAQSPKFKSKYLNSIDSTSLKQHVYVLASDSLQGRDTGSEGEHKAARYIVNHFKSVGLKPFNDSTYLQNIGLWSWRWDSFQFKLKDKQLTHYEDIVYLSTAPIEPSISGQCIFIGNGNDSITEHLNMKSKIAVALVDNLNSWYSLASKTKRDGAIALVMVHQSDSDAFSKLSAQMEAKHNKQSIYRSRPSFSNNLTKAFAISQDCLESLFNNSLETISGYSTAKAIKQLPQPELTIACPIIIEKANANNVAGYLPGKTKSQETLVISAHYDHVGERYDGICVGADDNASGTAAVIELAKAFAPLKGKLDKNIVFLATSGEEKGLLGAFYFADHPQEHAFNIKANINVDMIGRIDSTHKSNYIYTIGNNHYPEFDSLLHVANNLLTPLTIQYDYNKTQGFGNFLRLSDHYAFHRINIPVLGFFSGLHPDYHKPTDTPDKINYREMEQRVKLIFTTAFLATQKSAFNTQDD
ncbi:M20/M25/M40 family metallo-hydrolase [Carboxylicivirga mesophila]|uniref:M20/M25/M40 family metallo-hydrolase n=1 Tax=Carboxylicivirga mesophila TaxID=1166478 RepID=A0ABS5KES0_9BACT|nr:M20/M25/M40 family metallo-hydrolase [Carboxylicivirga mesophila]MBS2213490.1 M20/M25/M40 family metallo-hydrolase [Carboxylicivirga mesophila]